MRERDILRACLDHLSNKRVFHWRTNTGAFKTGERFIRFGVPGVPDILACVKGQMLGIEVKGPSGEQSQAQKEFQTALEQAGGRYLLIRSVEELIHAL